MFQSTYLRFDKLPFLVPNKWDSSLRRRRVCIICIRHSSNSCPRNVLTYFNLSDTCFVAQRSDGFRSMYPGVSNLRQEYQSLPTALNGTGATRQTSLYVTEDEMKLQEREMTTPRQRSLHRFPRTGTWVVFRSKRERTDRSVTLLDAAFFEPALSFVSCTYLCTQT